jgi:aspartyl aminopeptidase
MSSNTPALNQDFLQFLNASPTPWHAVANLVTLFKQAGFHELKENQQWQLRKGEAYYLVRAGSSIIAFIYGSKALQEGLGIVGAHTDSPCLKLKPQPEWQQNGYSQFGVEVYGGVLLAPWFDRDLSLAGTVSWVDKQHNLQQGLIDFREPIAVIPSLAIHLDRDVNRGREINPELHMKPILQQAAAQIDFRQYLKNRLLAEGRQVEQVLDFNLSFYDTQPAALIGENKEFIAGARLDNLLSCYIGARALLATGRDFTRVLVCNDHEEVGSRSDIGAQGPMLKELLERLQPESAQRQQMLRASVMVSVDNAHGIHPNYAGKHDKNHGPLLNAGPVLKYNANQSYATASDTAAMMRRLAVLPNQAPIPLQAFAIRADMLCGSTIGPLTAAQIGVRTVDLGVPTFGMHSIRELGGAKDTHYLFDLLSRFLAEPVVLADPV